jgi:hypothetical protein
MKGIKGLRELIRSFGAHPNSSIENKIVEYVKNNFNEKNSSSKLRK